jgi:hypothetical protein
VALGQKANTITRINTDLNDMTLWFSLLPIKGDPFMTITEASIKFKIDGRNHSVGLQNHPVGLLIKKVGLQNHPVGLLNKKVDIPNHSDKRLQYWIN